MESVAGLAVVGVAKAFQKKSSLHIFVVFYTLILTAATAKKLEETLS